MDAITLEQGLNKRASHIFRNIEGHFSEDTPANRKILIDTALNADNYLGTDKWGNNWYAQTQGDGTQIWVQVRNGEIINGGFNNIPRPWNTLTGFSRPSPP
ncbi:MAG: hypothetical protein AB4426_29180 [Xenococcaceae cyanobacterium]